MRRVRWILCLVMTLAMLMSCISVYGAEAETKKNSRFVTSVIFIWGSDTQAWQPAAPQTTYIIDTDADLGKGAQNVKIYPYDKETFDPGKVTEGAQNKLDYDRRYMPYAVKGMTTSLKTQPDASGKITYSYGMLLDSVKIYDVAKQLTDPTSGGEQEIRDLMGYVSPEIEKFLADARNEKLGPGIMGYLYFMPYVIEWETPVITCGACHKCKLHGDGNFCTEDTCDNFDTADCGCYVPPFVEPPQVIPPDGTNGCNSIIKWSETESHSYSHSPGCKTKRVGTAPNRRTVRYCPGHTCNHVFTYQTQLTATAALNPTSLKSGYGFGVTVNNSISTKQTGNSGACASGRNKANALKPAPPAAVEARLGWTVKNRLGTQPKTVQLAKSSSTATASQFVCAQNRISEIKERKIYTDVALAGTTKKPKSHAVTIVISGGGVNGVPFCLTLAKSIVVNGDMYEDDKTVDTH